MLLLGDIWPSIRNGAYRVTELYREFLKGAGAWSVSLPITEALGFLMQRQQEICIMIDLEGKESSNIYARFLRC